MNVWRNTKQLIILEKSLQLQMSSKNVYLWHLICQKSHAVFPKRFNSISIKLNQTLSSKCKQWIWPKFSSIFLYSIIINTTHLHFLRKEFNDLWLTRLAAELGHTCNNRRVEWPIERIYERRRFEAPKEGHSIDSWGYYMRE